MHGLFGCSMLVLLFGLVGLVLGLLLPAPRSLPAVRRLRHLLARFRAFVGERARPTTTGPALVFPQTADETDSEGRRRHERLRRILASATREYLPLGRPLPGASLVFVPRLCPADECSGTASVLVERYRTAEGPVRVVAYVCTAESAGSRSVESIVGDYGLVWKYLAGVGWPAWEDEGLPQCLVLPVGGVVMSSALPSRGADVVSATPTMPPDAPTDPVDEGEATGIIYARRPDPLAFDASDLSPAAP